MPLSSDISFDLILMGYDDICMIKWNLLVVEIQWEMENKKQISEKVTKKNTHTHRRQVIFAILVKFQSDIYKPKHISPPKFKKIVKQNSTQIVI